MKPSSDWVRAFLGQALTQGAFSQNRQVKARLKAGVRRITLTLDLKGFQRGSFFSRTQTYSHRLQPVHLAGSTATNFLSTALAMHGISVKLELNVFI
jgi:hypothetical protein